MSEMKKLILISVLLLLSLSAAAQTQTGYVRTLERPHQASVGLEGVTVNILEYPNAIVTKKKGRFSFSIPGKKQGTSFTVSRIEKKGYTLVDKQLRGRRYAYSADVPLEIVMVSNQQLEKDKRQIEKKAIDKAKKNYEQQIASLEKQLQEQAITEQEHGEQLERLAQDYENYIGLIDKMAERYALTDYKGLSDINRRINECIENAELERADSLINSKGDFCQREQELRTQMELNRKAAEVLAQSQRDAEYKLNDLAQDYYNKYTIFAANYQNDSAAYYLERRANLSDTTNVEWLYDVACYLKDIGNIDKAMSLFMRAHNQYVKSGAIDIRHALILETIADIYYIYNHNCERSVQYYTHAIDAFEKINYLHPHLVHCYDYLALGLIVVQASNNKATTNDVNKALISSKIGGRYDNDSIPPVFFGSNIIMNRIIDSQTIDVENVYLGEVIAFGNDDVKKLFNYYERALNKVDSVYGSDSERYAKVQVAYGNALMRYSKDNEGKDRALKCYQTAYQVFTNIDSMHPDLGDLYKSLAPIYLRIKKDTIAAINYYHKAIHIYSSLFGLHHPELSQIYDGLTGLYKTMNIFDQALDYGFLSIELKNRLYGPAISNRGNLTISSIYRDMGDYDKAIEYLEVYRNLYEKNQLKSSHNLSFFDYSYYSELGDIYFLKKEYSNALEAYHRILDYYKAKSDSVSLSRWEDYGKMGYVIMFQGDTVMAVKYFIRSLELLQNGKWSPDWKSDIESYCDNITKYYDQKEFTNAVNCYHDFLNYLSQNKHITRDGIVPRRSILKLIMQCKQNK